MSCINDYLKGERGEWLTVESVARTLTALGATTEAWPRMSMDEYTEAIEAAIASGEVECAKYPRMIRYREPKPKTETVVQGRLF